MSGSNGYSIVPVQGVMFPLRIIQLILGFIVFGISCYHCSLLNGFGFVDDPSALGVFTGLITLIYVAYWLVANNKLTSLYNYWAIFAVELFVLIFWLCTFALFADRAAAINGAINYGYGFNYKTKAKRSVSANSYSGTLYTALTFSTINFVLFGVTFFIFTVNMFRHRKALKGNPAPMHLEQAAATR